MDINKKWVDSSLLMLSEAAASWNSRMEEAMKTLQREDIPAWRRRELEELCIRGKQALTDIGTFVDLLQQVSIDPMIIGVTLSEVQALSRSLGRELTPEEIDVLKEQWVTFNHSDEFREGLANLIVLIQGGRV